MIGQKAIKDFVMHKAFREKGLICGRPAFGALDHRKQQSADMLIMLSEKGDFRRKPRAALRR
jgi:hypothetical protein